MKGSLNHEYKIESVVLPIKLFLKRSKRLSSKANLNQRGNLIGLFDKEKKIIGAGSLYTNSFHPYRDYIRNIHIDKDLETKD